MLTIWHNPRCRKSRETLALIEASGTPVTIRRYLEDAPSAPEIYDILKQLEAKSPAELMRRGEAIYKENNLKGVTDAAKLVNFMAKNPILIERPVVTNGQNAIIGRPPETVKTLL
jgi:arsenate reductase